MKHTIETYSGKYLDYLEPLHTDIDVADIARGLSYIPRFAGQTKFFWSVAAHSLLVRRIVYDRLHPPDVVLAALLHDAHEAYIGDVPTPLKRLYGQAYESIRHDLDCAIGVHFGISPLLFRHPAIKQADAIALRVEAEALKSSGGADPRWDRMGLGDVPGTQFYRDAVRDDGLDPEANEEQFVLTYLALEKRLEIYAPTS